MWRKFVFLALVVPLHIFVFQAVGTVVGGLVASDVPLPFTVLVGPALALCVAVDWFILTRWVGFDRSARIGFAVIISSMTPIFAGIYGIYSAFFTPWEALLAASFLTIALYWSVLPRQT